MNEKVMEDLLFEIRNRVMNIESNVWMTTKFIAYLVNTLFQDRLVEILSERERLIKELDEREK